MNIQEYQAKNILSQYGLEIPKGAVATTPIQAQNIAKNIGGNAWVIKAQVHAGGRGKAGGIKITDQLSSVEGIAKSMLGSRIVTKQTSAEGELINAVYVEAASKIQHEYYLSLVLDRANSCVVFIGSTEGGMDIEEVAEKSPEKICKVRIDIASGISDFHIRKMAFSLELDKDGIKQIAHIMRSMYKIFMEKDALQIEINPLIKTSDGVFVILDAKFSFDSNALYRNKDIEQLDDKSTRDPLEIRAEGSDLNYIKMTGSIGCMVNGAGLAMATMDIIQLYGSSPANFLDVGGSATEEKVTEAFKIITFDPNVKGILVNIFGGIMRCDVIANGIIKAANSIGIKIPIVVRLEGTNAELGKKLLDESGIALQSASDLIEAAEKIIAATS